MLKSVRTSPSVMRAGAPERSFDAGGGVIDCEFLSRQTLGDRSLQKELLALFDREAQRIMAELAKLVDGEPRRRSEFAHGLEGAALVIGAFEVARAAKSYKTSAEGPLYELVAELRQLENAVREARAEIAELLGRG